MSTIYVQVQLQDKYAEAFDTFKNRPEMGGIRSNTKCLHEIIRTLPEWVYVNQHQRPDPATAPAPTPATEPEKSDE